MIKTALCDFLGIKYPIIQAGMGPFGTTKLCAAATNAGVFGADQLQRHRQQGFMAGHL